MQQKIYMTSYQMKIMGTKINLKIKTLNFCI